MSRPRTTPPRRHEKQVQDFGRRVKERDLSRGNQSSSCPMAENEVVELRPGLLTKTIKKQGDGEFPKPVRAHSWSCVCVRVRLSSH